jgi:GTP cyclohydrolase IA
MRPAARPPPVQSALTPKARQAMARAVRSFLRAAGLKVEGDLARTPERVAEAWATDFLDGYCRAPELELGELHPAPDAGLVCVTGLDFHSTCPHHLLPYRGLAHLAYLPARGAGAKVAGFSRLAALVDALAHRLVLQEALAHQIATSLQRGTGARGAGCVLEAEQTCLSCRAEEKVRARTVASAFTGILARDRDLTQRFHAVIAAGLSTPREPIP